MLSAGRKPSAEATRLVRLTLPVQVDVALERLAKIGFYGRSESEVVFSENFIESPGMALSIVLMA